MVYEDRIARLYVQREFGYAQRARDAAIPVPRGSFRHTWEQTKEAERQAVERVFDTGISQLLAMEPEPHQVERYALRAAAAFWKAEIRNNASPEVLRAARERANYLMARYRELSSRR